MRLLVGIGHPAHVHFYKNAVWRLLERGDEVLLAARDKDVTLDLLDAYQLPYEIISAVGHGRLGMLSEYLRREWSYSRLIRSFKPDAVTEIGGLFAAPICRLLGVPSLVFTDTEIVELDRVLTHPLATVIYTPDCFLIDLGQKQVRYAGFHELAYLHPKYFRPDRTVLDDLGVDRDESFSIVRFVAWQASHDLGQSGFSPEAQFRLVETMQQYGRVFITSETKLDATLEPLRISLPPHQIHDILYFATLFIGESATMATEAGILGTPSIYVSNLATSLGNFQELQSHYELVYSFDKLEQALRKVVEILELPDAKNEWHQRKESLIADKIDVTDWLVGTVLSEGNMYLSQ